MSHTQDFHNVIVQLFRVAKRDGIITESEMAIINNVRVNLEKFVHILEQAEEDGYIDKKEAEDLSKMKEMISLQAYETALIDNILSNNEVTLLKSLTKMLNKYLTL